MKKFDTYIVNKIFTVPYLDRMISEDSIPDSFFECVRRYVKTDDATIGEAISEIYHFMNYEYRNEYYYKNTILNQLLIKNINALMFVFLLIQRDILFLIMRLQLQRISHGKDVLFKILKN